MLFNCYQAFHSNKYEYNASLNFFQLDYGKLGMQCLVVRINIVQFHSTRLILGPTQRTCLINQIMLFGVWSLHMLLWPIRYASGHHPTLVDTFHPCRLPPIGSWTTCQHKIRWWPNLGCTSIEELRCSYLNTHIYYRGHFTHETKNMWPLHFKHSLWWKRRSWSKFTPHYTWGTDGVCECKMDGKSTWSSTWHQIDYVSWSLRLF
jgi:hypothetical protein